MPRSRLPRLSSIKGGSFEPSKRNPISLRNDEGLDSHLKQLKIGGESSPISISDNLLNITEDFSVEKNSEFHQELKVSGELYADNALPIVVSRTGLTTFRHSEEAQSCVSIRASADGAGTLTFSEEAGTILSDGGALTIGWTGILYLEDDNTQAATLQDLGGSAVFQLNNNSANAGNFNITVNANGGTDITTLDSDGALGHLSFAPNGDLKLNPSSAKTIITATDGLYFDGGTDTYIHEVSADKLEIVVGADEMVTLDEANQRITLESDKLVYKAGAGDEYSVEDSAYAGMILGYRCIGEDSVHASYTLTTSFAVPHADMTTRFIAPPSGNVEVMVQIFMNSSTSNKILYLGLSDNATYNSLGVQYEHNAQYPDETDDGTIQHFWTITGLTAGDTYNYWLGAKTSGTNKFLIWGGDSSGRYPDFIMKVVALPKAVSDFATFG